MITISLPPFFMIISPLRRADYAATLLRRAMMLMLIIAATFRRYATYSVTMIRCF